MERREFPSTAPPAGPRGGGQVEVEVRLGRRGLKRQDEEGEELERHVEHRRDREGDLLRRLRPARLVRPRRSCSWPFLAPQDDQAEMGESALLRLGQGPADRAVARHPFGPDDDVGGAGPRPAPRAFPARRRRVACSAHHASAAVPSSVRLSTSSPPSASSATTSRSSARSAPGSAAGRPAGGSTWSPLPARAEMDQHHEERDELEHHVEQRRQVRVHPIIVARTSRGM